LSEYFPVLVFLAIALVIAIVMLVIPHIVNPAKTKDVGDKLAPYECGFEAFDSAYRKFDIRFYLVAILFVVFDLEVVFLFPWVMTFTGMGWGAFTCMMIFLAILTIGFVYEWRKGALDWE